MRVGVLVGIAMLECRDSGVGSEVMVVSGVSAAVSDGG